MFLWFINIIILVPLVSLDTFKECPVYTCAKLEDGKCSKRHELNSYYLQECPHKSHCAFNDEADNSVCLSTEYEYNKPAYPGGKCSTSIDCLSNNCVNNICQGKDICKDSSQCFFDTYCDTLESKCKPVKRKGDSCSNDYECHWSLGCDNNSKCSDFFSIENGAPNTKSKERLCKSGLVYNEHCNSINDSKESSCIKDSHCNYIDSNDQLLTIPNACVCSIDSNPRTLCKSGDINNPYWMTVVRLLKEIMNQENRKCNALESKPGFCREELRNDWNARNIQIELSKSMILFDQNTRLNKSVPCGLKSILGFDDTPPLPKEKQFQCPKYSCIDDNGNDINYKHSMSCANSTNPFNEQGSDIEVSLKQVCNEGYRCNFNQTQVFSNWTTNSSCEEIPTSQSWSYKFPGEVCISHNQCIKGGFEDVGFCIDGFCSGHDENNECKSHGDCLKGFFCNGKYCQEQKGEQHFCLEAFECLNYLGCLNNTCVRYYSLPNGTYLNSSNPDASLCQMGVMNEKTNQCAIKAYYNLSEDSMVKDVFVECAIGQMCNYTTGYFLKGKPTINTEQCSCGYSVSGKSFCPLPQTLNQEDWKELFRLMNKRFDNKCHTLRRHVCLNEVTFRDQDKLNWYKRKTIFAHLYHQANECIIKVLSSPSLVINQLSLYLVLFLLLLN